MKISAVLAGAALALASNVAATGVFCHYMVAGVTAEQAATDVKDAKAMGIDAFALNVQTLESWATEAIQYLFDASMQEDFKLFFSFDMESFTCPSQYLTLIEQYHANESYYTVDEKPFVSTFYGGTLNFGYSSVNDGWQNELKDALSAQGIQTYFVPSFNNWGGNPSDFFNDMPMVDGIFNWDGSWAELVPNATVTQTTDQQYFAAAQAAKKSFIMGISSFQFKHMSSSANYYKGNAIDLADRINQILDMSPDFIEIQTWNDAGEGHYIGNVWPNALATSPEVAALVDGYDHTPFQIPLAHLINAYKNGHADLTNNTMSSSSNVEGAFWYHTLLTSGDCSADYLGKPSGMDVVEDAVTVAIVMSAVSDGTKINVYSGGDMIASQSANLGLNAFSAQGMKEGQQYVEVVDAGGNKLAYATGNTTVSSSSNLCNYNFQVVTLG